MRDVKEMPRANEVLKTASAFFCAGGVQPPIQVVKVYIDCYRNAAARDWTSRSRNECEDRLVDEYCIASLTAKALTGELN